MGAEETFDEGADQGVRQRASEGGTERATEPIVEVTSQGAVEQEDGKEAGVHRTVVIWLG